MTSRRIVALLVMLLMVHLDVARAFAACAGQADHRAVEHSQVHTAAHEHAAVGHAHASTADRETPATPQAECCRAMASCLSTAALGHTEPSPHVSASHAIAVPDSRGVALSPVSAPEPPPPRA